MGTNGRACGGSVCPEEVVPDLQGAGKPDSFVKEEGDGGRG